MHVKSFDSVLNPAADEGSTLFAAGARYRLLFNMQLIGRQRK